MIAWAWEPLDRFQAEITPASESKMNLAAPVPPSLNPDVLFHTIPVGAPPGIETTSGTICGMLPLTPPVYSVDTLVPLSFTHSGVLGPAAIPHGFTRFGSVMRG